MRTYILHVFDTFSRGWRDIAVLANSEEEAITTLQFENPQMDITSIYEVQYKILSLSDDWDRVRESK